MASTRMGRPPNSESGRGETRSVHWSKEALKIIEAASLEGASFSRTANLIVEGSSPEIAHKLASNEAAIKTLTQENTEKDAIIERLASDLEELKKSQERSKRVGGIDLTGVHPTYHEVVAKAMGAKP